MVTESPFMEQNLIDKINFFKLFAVHRVIVHWSLLILRCSFIKVSIQSTQFTPISTHSMEKLLHNLRQRISAKTSEIFWVIMTAKAGFHPKIIHNVSLCSNNPLQSPINATLQKNLRQHCRKKKLIKLPIYCQCLYLISLISFASLKAQQKENWHHQMAWYTCGSSILHIVYNWQQLNMSIKQRL